MHLTIECSVCRSLVIIAANAAGRCTLFETLSSWCVMWCELMFRACLGADSAAGAPDYAWCIGANGAQVAGPALSLTSIGVAEVVGMAERLCAGARVTLGV